MRKFLLPGSALALFVASVAPASAQVATTQPAPAVQVQPAAAINAHRAKAVLGSKVFVQNNTGVGTVDDIVFDDQGAIEYLLVSSEGKLVSVPWDAAKFNPQQQSATVNVTPQQWQTIPTFTTTTYPNFYTPQYQTTTYKYFNLTPGQARRLERRTERRAD